jgi:NitT/TauT family transport system substrate-binding protein
MSRPGLASVILAIIMGCSLPASGKEVKRPLTVALSRTLDTLPFLLAEQNGYFDEEGTTVQALPGEDAAERLLLLRAGRIDGMLSTLTEAAILNREDTIIRVVMTTRRPYPGSPVFTILTMPGAGIESAADLSGVPLALTENTVSEYIADRLRNSSGLEEKEIVDLPMPNAPARFHSLINGRVKAAILPHPLSQGAASFGAVTVTDDTRIPIHVSTVMAFSVDSLAERSDDIDGFLRAWARAAADINLFPRAYRRLLVGHLRVPPRIRGSVSIPPFPTGEVPSKSQWDDVVSWLAGKGLIEKSPAYGDSVTDAFFRPAADLTR